MPVNYQLGKIYTVVNTENDIIYVGSTVQKHLSTRFAGHKVDALRGSAPWNLAMRTIGCDKFRIILHHAFPCNSKDELEAEEYRVLEEIIASGKQVYNAVRQGKHSEETRKKMAQAQKGAASVKFTFGSIKLATSRGMQPAWVFKYVDDSGVRHSKSFAIQKYGNYGARFRAEETRRAIYPEWRNEEDICCDELGAIELD